MALLTQVGRHFGIAYNFSPLPFSITLTYDPSTFSGDTCGVAAGTSCTWNVSALTEQITINSHVKTYTAPGTITYCVSASCGGDTISFSALAPSLVFGGTLKDTNLLFSSQTNVNNPNLLVAFSNVALTGSNSSSAISTDGSLFLNVTPAILGSSGGVSDPAPAAVAVPEPVTLSLFGAGLAGAAALRRRKKRPEAKPLAIPNGTRSTARVPFVFGQNRAERPTSRAAGAGVPSWQGAIDAILKSPGD